MTRRFQIRTTPYDQMPITAHTLPKTAYGPTTTLASIHKEYGGRYSVVIGKAFGKGKTLPNIVEAYSHMVQELRK